MDTFVDRPGLHLTARQKIALQRLQAQTGLAPRDAIDLLKDHDWKLTAAVEAFALEQMSKLQISEDSGASPGMAEDTSPAPEYSITFASFTQATGLLEEFAAGIFATAGREYPAAMALFEKSKMKLPDDAFQSWHDLLAHLIEKTGLRDGPARDILHKSDGTYLDMIAKYREEKTKLPLHAFEDPRPEFQNDAVLNDFEKRFADVTGTTLAYARSAMAWHGGRYARAMTAFNRARAERRLTEDIWEHRHVGYVAKAVGKLAPPSELSVIRATLAIADLAAATGMTFEYSHKLLAENGWCWHGAQAFFLLNKANLPLEAFSIIHKLSQRTGLTLASSYVLLKRHDGVYGKAVTKFTRHAWETAVPAGFFKPPSKEASFLTLPPEIRNKIYEFCSSDTLDNGTRLPGIPKIMWLCAQTRREASDIWFSHTPFSTTLWTGPSQSDWTPQGKRFFNWLRIIGEDNVRKIGELKLTIHPPLSMEFTESFLFKLSLVPRQITWLFDPEK